MELRIVFLGTSSAVPTRGRGLSSVAVLRGGELILFDVGEGTQRSMINASLGMNRKMKVFITHMHGDHCVGLLGLLQTMSLVGRDRPIDIYGPLGIEGFLRSNMEHLRFNLTFDTRVHTVHPPDLVVRDEGYVVRACPSEHSILSYAYLLEEDPRPGVFHPERARELGLPEGRLWSLLQQGKSVSIEGREARPEDVLGPSRPGRKIGVSGDTRPSEAFIQFFKGCDVLIFDSTYGKERVEKAVENMHSTAEEAALLAREAGARLLILTHFSARYNDTQTLVEEASKMHPNVMAAYDLMAIDVPYPEG